MGGLTPNVFTVDVEDWFNFEFGGFSAPMDTWSSLPSRVELGVDRLLGLLSDAGAVGTFFVLGWVGERHPGLVRRIAQAGHEIGCHSYAHQAVHGMSPAAFAEDLRRARGLLQDVSGAEVASFRAPMFSITQDMGWAFEALVRAGFRYDSSLFPGRRLDGGAVGADPRPHVISTPAGELAEFPISLLSLGKRRIPLFGGGYFRLAPLPMVLLGARLLARQGQPVMFYIHPHDLDADQPRVVKGRLGQFRRYHGIEGAPAKLAGLLREVPFTRLDRAWDAGRGAS